MSSGFQTTEELLSDAIDLMDDEDYEGALPMLARVVSFEPGNDLAYELWVTCHLELDRFERVLELADAGLAQGRAPVGLNILKVGAFHGLQRDDDAFLAAQAALEADPSSSNAIFMMMTTAEKTGRAALVIEHARNYLRLFGKNAVVLDCLGKAYLVQFDFRRADRAFRDAAQLDPESIDHHVSVLLTAHLAGNHEAIDKYLDRLDPELAEQVEDEFELLLDMPDED